MATESGGPALLSALKRHVIETMLNEPACAPSATGLSNVEIEELSGLALSLDSQDHFLTYSILHSLMKEGAVEQVRYPASPRRPKYRLL